MRGLLWLLAAFALAAGLSVALRESDAYVLLVYAPWRVELSLILAVVLLFAGFVLGYFIVRVAVNTLNLPVYVRAFRVRQRERKGIEALVQSLQSLLEGRSARAGKLAAQAFESGVAPSLASLVAARAAQQMRNPELRDRWLASAREAEPQWRQAVAGAAAQLLIEERRFEEARALLRELHAGGARHIATLQALLRVEQALGNQDEVVRIARVLEKRGAMPATVLRTVIANAQAAIFESRALDAPSVAKRWRAMSGQDRREPRIAAAAARASMKFGDCPGAHRIIEEALAAAWNADLVRLYGECREDALARIERAEMWLKEHPRDADLLLTLGRLCMQCELWGKARSYFEASLALAPGRAVHIALADLCDRTGRIDEANRHFRAGADPKLV